MCRNVPPTSQQSRAVDPHFGRTPCRAQGNSQLNQQKPCSLGELNGGISPKARKSMAAVLFSTRERGLDRMIGHDSDVEYSSRHDRIDMHCNFNTSAKVTSSTTVELSGSQQDGRWGAELCRHESGLKRVAVPRRRRIPDASSKFSLDQPSPWHCDTRESRLVTGWVQLPICCLAAIWELHGR